MKKLLVHLHLFYHNQVDYMIEKLSNINGCKWDLFVTFCENNADSKKKIWALKPDAKFLKVENRGYDCWPFIQVLKNINLDDYDYVLKLHTKNYYKKETSLNGFIFTGYQWRDSLVNALVGSKEIFKKNLDILNSKDDIGMIVDKNFFLKLTTHLPEDTILLPKLKERLKIASNFQYFIAGTIFIIRANILKPLLENTVFKKTEFPMYSKTATNSTIAHAMERIFTILCDDMGYKVYPSDASCKNKMKRVNIKYFKYFPLFQRKYYLKKDKVIKKIRIFGITIFRRDKFIDTDKYKWKFLFGIFSGNISKDGNIKTVRFRFLGISLWRKKQICQIDFPKGTITTEYTNKNFTIKKMHRVAVFASFSSNGKIADYVVYYLKGLKKVCDAIIFIADNPILPKEMEKIKDLVIYAKFDRHEEYDFGSYKRGYEYAKQSGILDKCDELVLCNDSCYGPVYPFENMFNKMDKSGCDFWGVCANTEFCYHLQSYFFAFKKNVFKSNVFDKFMVSIKGEKGVQRVIQKYETTFTKTLLNAGFKCDSFIQYKSENYYPYDYNLNVTKFPLYLMKHKCPLLKVKALKGSPGSCFDYLDVVFEYLEKENKELYKILKD
ncbi:MAG: hypothetical protein IJ638_03850 [Alphaproteobacteria bacterium]|nr:hypothetical protein [Alphaproteobacteria bacterium]